MTNAESGIRELLFGEGLLDMTVNHGKGNTLRVYRPEAHYFGAGESFIGLFALAGTDSRLALPLITTAATDVKTWGELTDAEAVTNGAANAAAALEENKLWYANLTEASPLGVISYCVAPDLDTFIRRIDNEVNDVQ